MRITNEADYALRIMRCLAVGECIVDAKSISEQINVPPQFTLKILRKLMSGGMVISFKGVKGGYKLAMMPTDITMRSIVESIDGPLNINKCLNDECVCTHPSNNKDKCFFHHVFDDINALIASELEKITLQMAIEDDKKINK